MNYTVVVVVVVVDVVDVVDFDFDIVEMVEPKDGRWC